MRRRRRYQGTYCMQVQVLGKTFDKLENLVIYLYNETRSATEPKDALYM